MEGWKKWILLPGLALYLLVLGVGSAFVVVTNFPSKDTATNKIHFPNETPSSAEAAKTESSETEGERSEEETGFVQRIVEISIFGKTFRLTVDQALMLLAFLAGVTGSFLHTAQSLASYVGNRAFRASWSLWYALRPWIGGVLGLTLFIVFGAGFVSGIDLLNPAAVVAVGLLGGWFSKTTTDKLQEVFETLFKTSADEKRKDSLVESPRPAISEIEPDPVPGDEETLTIRGSGFHEEAAVQLGDDEIAEEHVTRHSGGRLEVALAGWEQRPTQRATVNVRVRNPDGTERLSRSSSVVFEVPEPLGSPPE